MTKFEQRIPIVVRVSKAERLAWMRNPRAYFCHTEEHVIREYLDTLVTIQWRQFREERAQ